MHTNHVLSRCVLAQPIFQCTSVQHNTVLLYAPCDIWALRLDHRAVCPAQRFRVCQGKEVSRFFSHGTLCKNIVCCVPLQAKLLSRLLDAANGLAYLHKQGVVHGDLKAANVLLQHAGHGGASYTTVSTLDALLRTQAGSVQIILKHHSWCAAATALGPDTGR